MSGERAAGAGSGVPGSPSRRALLGWGGAGLAAGSAVTAGSAWALQQGDGGAGDAAVPFHGVHQAGVSTPVQDRLQFAAFDVTTHDPGLLAAVLQEWTRAAERMTAGQSVGAGTGPSRRAGGSAALAQAPPDDTGEVRELGPARLTLTFGVGPSLFDGRRGFGKLAAQRPAALVELPRFAGDELDAGRSGGDLAVQACADDPQVAVHAIRNLARIGADAVALRWVQAGYGKAASTTPQEPTPRDVLGFKNGTGNISGSDVAALDAHVWVDEGDGPGWMVGGSYLVARRIRLRTESWDRASLKEQEDIVGRDKAEGAPAGRQRERDEPLLGRMRTSAHVRLAHPDAHGGARMLRRSYSFADGSDGAGRLDAGLFFLAYQRDVRRGFVPVQRALAQSDALNEYVQHVSSAVFAVPGGVRDGGDWWGRALFGGADNG